MAKKKVHYGICYRGNLDHLACEAVCWPYILPMNGFTDERWAADKSKVTCLNCKRTKAFRGK